MKRPAPPDRSKSGLLEEVPLADLLSMFATSRAHHVLVVRSESDDVGEIRMRKGVVYHASIDDLEAMPARKSLFRMLTWRRGFFDLEPPHERELPFEASLDVEEVLPEGLLQRDALDEALCALPDLATRFVVAQPAPRDLAPEDRETLDLVHAHGRLQTVLDRSPTTDLDTARSMLRLVAAGLIRSA